MSDLYNRFVEITKAHVKSLKLEVKMPDKEYICLSCGATFQEIELDVCENCGHIRCPRIIGKGRKREICGGEVSIIEEHDKAMKEMYNEN